MCGRYTIALDIDVLLDQLDLILDGFEFEPRFNIAPTQMLPVVLDESPDRLQRLRWGLVPFWAKDPRIGNKLINARGETVASKPSFREAFKKRRCLAVADGFYEWKKGPLGKVPHHIRRKDRKAFTIGGLWESWKDPEDRELRTFTLITTTPNALMAPIHDRMPVLIAPEHRDEWLHPETTRERLQELIRPCSEEGWEAVPVSTAVNSPRNEGPNLLNPPQTLF